MKRLLCVLFCIIFSATMFSSCITPSGIRHGLDNYDPGKEEEFAVTVANKIRKSLDAKDKNMLKSLLTKDRAKNEQTDKEIDEVMAYYKGKSKKKVVEADIVNVDEVESGYKTMCIQVDFDIKTDKGTYYLYFGYCTLDEKEGNTGIDELQILSENKKPCWIR